VLVPCPKKRTPDRRTSADACARAGAVLAGSWVFIDGPTGDDNHEPEWFKQERGYVADSQPGVLYDLSRDLSEKTNLYADHPEIVQDLKSLLQRYKSEGRSVGHRSG